jgi:hypothetical protein
MKGSTMRVRRRLAAAAATAAAAVAALVCTGAAFATGPAPVTGSDPTGDYVLIDGHHGPRSASIDIESMRWARSHAVLRVSVVIRRLRPDHLNQYAVFRAVDPAGRHRFLIQASTVTPVAHVATGSWAHPVRCPDATARVADRADGTGRITAAVPLRCLDRPATLRRLRVQTLARSYYMDKDFSLDRAHTPKVLRLR